MHRRHLVLFAHGARDAEWARPLEALRARVAALVPDHAITLAFLEFMPPTLAQAVTAAVGVGATRITIVPVFLAQGGHLRRDLPAVVADLRAAHPAVAIDVLPAIGEQPAVIEAIAGCVAQLAAHAD